MDVYNTTRHVMWKRQTCVLNICKNKFTDFIGEIEIQMKGRFHFTIHDYIMHINLYHQISVYIQSSYCNVLFLKEISKYSCISVILHTTRDLTHFWKTVDNWENMR